MTCRSFFNFMSLRGTAQKRPCRGPLLTLGGQRETLWTPLPYFSWRVENTNEQNCRPYGKLILADRRGLRVTFYRFI